ncbi:MAG TPA: hypothetical protein VMQ76_00180 [Terracidiphilus sp.]|nr:hypothetical protein [Terracidiphilus sp.]
MSDLSSLWDEHSRLMDRMMDAVQVESEKVIHTVKTGGSTVRVRLTGRMLFNLVCGCTLRFKTDKADIILTRKLHDPSQRN